MIRSLKCFARDTPILSDAYCLARVLADSPVRDWRRLGRLNLFRKVYPNTMVGYARLANTHDLARLAERDGLPGAFVECGVWKGGCAAVMAWVARQAGSGRSTWLFDSFEGLPEPTEEDGARAWEYVAGCAAPQEAAEELLFARLKIDPRSVHVVKGWFQDTLPACKSEIGPIAILRVDGDFYESTRCCLEHLYEQTVQGGYVIIDDYGYWAGCRKATDEFLESIDVELRVIDEEGRFFIKP
jgi:hypothetical protein